MSSLPVVLVLLLPGAPSTPADAGCVACHSENGEHQQRGVHASLACHDCHAGAGAKGHPDVGKMPHVPCASCHEDVDKDYRESVHAALHAQGDTRAPNCVSCHGPVHEILPASDPASRTAKRNLPETCGACHANPDFLATHKVPFARPVETYRLSVHGRAVQKGEAKAPSCSDCHGSHAIVPARSEKSPIHHSNVAATCSKCHVEIGKVFAASIHGEAAARGVRDAPVCTDCHGEHAILAPAEAGSLVNAARVSTVTCGRCHGDERLAVKFNLPADRVEAYKDSFHGLARRSGSQTVANCASCHGVHNILPSRDPNSTVYPANLGKTCGACHQGAGQRFAIGRIHTRAGTASEHPVVRAIRILYLWLIPLTLGFMVIHNGLDFVAKLVRGAPAVRSGQRVPRMNRRFRIAHGLTVLSFPVLVVTGFALKDPESWWARPFVAWEGEAAVRGAVHRIAAVVLLVSLLYHVVHLALSRRDRSILREMMPGLDDARALWGMVRYNLGLARERPTFGRFSYAEKMEYLAYMWGAAVMAVTGFLLWFNNITLAYLPSWVADAATVTHFYEAVLATVSIFVWHFYMVIFDPVVYPMDLSWITGQASADHLRETRPEYYRDRVKSLEPPAPTPGGDTEAAPLAAPDTKGPTDE